MEELGASFFVVQPFGTAPPNRRAEPFVCGNERSSEDRGGLDPFWSLVTPKRQLRHDSYIRKENRKCILQNSQRSNPKHTWG